MTLTIFLWATDKLHHIEASAISVLCVLLLVMPGIGVTTCNDLYKRVDWNSILLFGAGISMAEMFTKTGGAAWLSKVAFVDSGMGSLSITMLAISIFVVVFSRPVLLHQHHLVLDGDHTSDHRLPRRVG